MKYWGHYGVKNINIKKQVLLSQSLIFGLNYLYIDFSLLFEYQSMRIVETWWIFAMIIWVWKNFISKSYRPITYLVHNACISARDSTSSSLYKQEQFCLKVKRSWYSVVRGNSYSALHGCAVAGLQPCNTENGIAQLPVPYHNYGTAAPSKCSYLIGSR